MTALFEPWSGASHICCGVQADATPFWFPLVYQVQPFPPSSGPATIKPGTYYRLDGTRRPVADALYIDNHGRFTLLKILISSRASIETKELQDLVDSLPVEASKKTWQLIFVVPEDRAANFEACLDNASWARKVDFYVLPLHLDRHREHRSELNISIVSFYF